MSYHTDKQMKILVMATIAIAVVLSVIYVAEAQKTQRARAIRLASMYSSGAVTLEQYKKLKKDNTFLNAIFNPKDVK